MHTLLRHGDSRWLNTLTHGLHASAFQMIVVVRGENYHRDDSDHNYEALARYVRQGGLLFATPWVAWETDQLSFASILPFCHLGGSHNEGIPLHAHGTDAPLAQELFGESFALEASCENLSPRRDAIVLLRDRDGVQPGTPVCHR